MKLARFVQTLVVLCAVSPRTALAADDVGANDGSAGVAPPTALTAPPIHGFTYSAGGAAPKTYGAATTGSALAGSGQKTGLGIGLRVWGSPIDRLTIVADGERRVTGEFSPTAGAMVRLYGAPNGPFVLGVIGKWKAEGFGSGKEIESEAETGILVAVHQGSFHLDANALAGVGLGDEAEADAEARLRVGFDIRDYFRLGLDGQFRKRIGGDRLLPGGRTWDFVGGPQVLASWKNFFASLTVGPSTMGWEGKNVGWLAMASIGGTT